MVIIKESSTLNTKLMTFSKLKIKQTKSDPAQGVRSLIKGTEVTGRVQFAKNKESVKYQLCSSYIVIDILFCT